MDELCCKRKIVGFVVDEGICFERGALMVKGPGLETDEFIGAMGYLLMI